MSLPPRTISRAQHIVAEGIPIGPRLYPCVCKAGRHAHSGAAHTGGSKATGCRRYRADTAWDLAYKALDARSLTLRKALRMSDDLEREKHRALFPKAEGEWSIGASDTATCPRKIQYRNVPPEDMVYAPEDKREALMGTIIHDEVTRRLAILFPWRESKGRVRIPGLDRQSEFDFYDPIIYEVEDLKTAGVWKWDQIGQHGPEWEVWEQTLLYGLALEDSGRPVKTLRLTYINRANGHDETFVMDYDSVAAKAALDRLLGYAQALDLSLDLPKTGTGPTNDPLCARCFARRHCWNIDAAEAAGRSPESFTVLGEDPETEQIAWAISEKVAADAAKREAESGVKAAKILLDGIEPGRYGEFEGYSRGGSSGPDHAEYAERLATFYDLPEDQRPALEDIPGPRDRKYTYISWGKVRKATLERERKERAQLDKGDE